MDTSSPDEPRPSAPVSARVRSVVAATLVVLIALVAPLAIVARWADRQLTDTDSYVETVTPLAQNALVQDAIIRRTTDEIVALLDLDSVTDQAMQGLGASSVPPLVASSLDSLSEPLADAAEQYVERTVGDVVRSEAFATAWVTSNELAHEQLVLLLTGDGGGGNVSVDGPTVSVDLAAVVATTRELLLERGFELAERIPELAPQFIIIESADLEKAQGAVSLLDKVAAWLPIVALVLLLVALALSRARRRLLLVAALAIAVTTVLLGIGLDVARSAYLDALPPDVDEGAAGAVFDTLTAQLRDSIQVQAVVALVVALVCWLVRPGGLGVRAIAAVRSGSTSDLSTGRVGTWVHARRWPLRWAAVGLGGAWYVLADRPPRGEVVTALVAVVVALVVIEVVARLAPAEPGESAESAGS